jgi:hypothetical protein
MLFTAKHTGSSSCCLWLSCLRAGRERKGVPYSRCPPKVACRVTREEGGRAVFLVELLVMSRISVISASVLDAVLDYHCNTVAGGVYVVHLDKRHKIVIVTLIVLYQAAVVLQGPP